MYNFETEIYTYRIVTGKSILEGMTLRMKPKNIFEKKIKDIHIPVLRLPYRILLYLITIVSITLAMLHVIFQCFPYAMGIAFYVLAACTLCASCYYLIINIKYTFKEKLKPAIVANPYTNKVATDYRLRTVLFAVSGITSNIIFAVFHGVIGIMSRSAWFGTLSAYYILLSIMRVNAVRQERRLSAIKGEKEHMQREVSVYFRNSILFIFMAIVLAGAVILLENSQGGKNYPGFTIYAVAAYTFYKLTLSIVNMIKVGKRKSPLLSMIRRIGAIDASASILTLQTAMFTAFAQEQEAMIKFMNGLTGTVVCLLVLFMGVQGICSSRKWKKDWRSFLND